MGPGLLKDFHPKPSVLRLDWYKPNGFSYHEGNLADSRMTKAAATVVQHICEKMAGQENLAFFPL